MTCYAAYDNEAPTYYCLRAKGHDGDHDAVDDLTGESLHSWPRSLEERASSQAGLASFRTHTPQGTRIWLCPRCHSRLDHGYTRGEGWESCTNPDCDYSLGDD